MNNAYIAACFILMTMKLLADCGNIHCRFEFTGASSVEEATKEDFLAVPALGGNADKYFERESVPFRELNWSLSRLELAAERNDKSAVSNAVGNVSRILGEYEANFKNADSDEERCVPRQMRMALLEKIELSLARMVLGKRRSTVAQYIDELLPESIIEKGRDVPSWHSIATFKRMLVLAVAIEDYKEKEECYPLNLDLLELSEPSRKCACGRDIDYELHGFTWILRSRCESYDGGLKFDEYIPMIYQQRKKLDLCFSSTFNAKRASLFNGELMGVDDNRLSGQVIHDSQRTGVHLIKFTNPNSGCSRIVPRSEQTARDAKRRAL